MGEQITVNVKGYEGLPSVKNLGDGTFHGCMSGHSFKYEEVEYYSEIGVRSPVYIPVTVVIRNGIETLSFN